MRGERAFPQKFGFWGPQGVILKKIPLYLLKCGRASFYGNVKPIKRFSSSFGSIFVKKHVFRQVIVQYLVL